jgi:peroxiredoxin
MIKVGDQVPNVETMHKPGLQTEWITTHDLWRNKRILLIGVPGSFLVEYPSTQLQTYDLLHDKITSLGIDEIWFTSVEDCYVQQAYKDFQKHENIKNLPDPAGAWASAIGMLEDMTEQGLGKQRSHRYAMIIDNLKMKVVKYEDWSHNPMTCFQVTDAESILMYLQGIRNTYEQWK